MKRNASLSAAVVMLVLTGVALAQVQVNPTQVGENCHNALQEVKFMQQRTPDEMPKSAAILAIMTAHDPDNRNQSLTVGRICGEGAIPKDLLMECFESMDDGLCKLEDGVWECTTGKLDQDSPCFKVLTSKKAGKTDGKPGKPRQL